MVKSYYLNPAFQSLKKKTIIIQTKCHWHMQNRGGGETQSVRLTHKKIRYCQIQKVVIALFPQTLVHFESKDDQRVAQNYHHHQSHHHHHQNDKHGSRVDGAALHASLAKIVAPRLGVPLLLHRHGASILRRPRLELRKATGSRRPDDACLPACLPMSHAQSHTRPLSRPASLKMSTRGRAWCSVARRRALTGSIVEEQGKVYCRENVKSGVNSMNASFILAFSQQLRVHEIRLRTGLGPITVIGLLQQRQTDEWVIVATVLHTCKIITT